jgi:outer membrane protein TolC
MQPTPLQTETQNSSNKRVTLLILLAILLAPTANAAKAKNLLEVAGVTTAPVPATPLKTLFDAALANSEELNAVKSSVRVAQLRAALAETGYYPTVSVEAIDSTGVPGSTGALGIGGLMGSPYRSGWGYGVVATQTLFDFGRTSRSVTAANKDVEAEKSQTEITRNEVAKVTLDTYLQCATSLSLQKNWFEIKKLLVIINKEINGYVKTGQRSIVETLLARTQLDEANRATDSLESRIGILRKRLAVITGLKEESILCPYVADVNDKVFQSFKAESNPYLHRALLQKDAADSRIAEAKAGYFPRLIAMGSLGDTEDIRFVDKQNYSLGIGLIIPLFDANQTHTEVERARSIAEVRGHEVKAVQQDIDDSNLRFDEIIQTTSVELAHFQTELTDVNQAVSEARDRYFAMHGSLVDLREAVRNFTKTTTEAAIAQSNLLRAKGFKAIYNGQL